jgi:hypothetical protein
MRYQSATDTHCGHSEWAGSKLGDGQERLLQALTMHYVILSNILQAIAWFTVTQHRSFTDPTAGRSFFPVQ